MTQYASAEGWQNHRSIAPMMVPVVSIYNFDTADLATGLSKRLASLLRLTDAEAMHAKLKHLWEIFVGTGVKSLAYFEATVEDSDEMQELFERINTGGVQLTQMDPPFFAVDPASQLAFPIPSGITMRCRANTIDSKSPLSMLESKVE